MPEVDRLGALQVGVGGRRPVAMSLRLRDERLHQALEQRDRPRGMRAHQQRQVGRHLVIPGAGRVQLAAERADQLGQAALDRHVDVLVLLPELEAPRVELGADLLEALGDRVQLGLVQHAHPPEGARVRLGLLDVEGGQAPIERDRGVDPPEQRVLLFAEAGHDPESRLGYRGPRRGPCRRGPPATHSSR
jgi:hypothetical protein